MNSGNTSKPIRGRKRTTKHLKAGKAHKVAKKYDRKRKHKKDAPD